MGRRDMLLLSIFTLVTTAGWIIFDVYHSFVTSTISEEVEQQIAPITHTFEQSVIDRIKNRLPIEPLTVETIEFSVPTPTESLTIATSSGQGATRSGLLGQGEQ